MTHETDDQGLQSQKLTRIWSDRRERKIAVRISYDREDAGDCQVYTIRAVEETE